MQLKELYFSPKGRINRQKFFLGGLCVGIVGYIIIMLISTILIELGFFLDMVEIFIIISCILNFCLYVIFIYAMTILQIKCWHDLDKSGWYVLLGYIPIANLITAIYLLFVKGTDGSNNFGEDPLK